MTQEEKDPYEQRVQYDSIKAGIQAHAKIYSFNIQSELFNQLTIEQQKLWRKEIEQACISGGDAGVELARDPRYKENLEVKEVNLEKEIKSFTEDLFHKVFDEDKSQDDFDWDDIATVIEDTAKYFVELGIQQSNYNKNEEKSYRNHFIDWQRNTDTNKPTKNHSILIQTTHGIAEGEWNGEKWIQYRWNSLLKDEDVLAWIELSNIEIPSSISLNLD